MSKTTTLPVSLKYKDKIELVHKILDIYSVVFTKMTKRNIDLLTICILEDVNASNFRKIVLNSGLGFNNEQHINTELNRLRKKGLLFIDSYMKNRLNNNLQRIKDIISNNSSVGLYFQFDNER